MYQNYIFDLYGTLVDIRTNENKAYLWDKMAEMFGFYGAIYTRTELKTNYYKYVRELEQEMKKTEECPEINLDNVIRRLFEDKGVQVEDCTIDFIQKMFRIVSTKFICLYDGVIDFLEALKKKGNKVYLLSNAQCNFTRPELTLLGIEKYFDGILISSEEGCKKPGSSFYNRLLERYHLDKKESIMIGNDSRSDILGSYQVGLDSLYIHTEISPECEKDLKSKYTIMDGDFRKIQPLILKQQSIYLVRKREQILSRMRGLFSFFVAKARQVQSCLHEIVFAGRKNMEHVVRKIRKSLSSTIMFV